MTAKPAPRLARRLLRLTAALCAALALLAGLGWLALGWAGDPLAGDPRWDYSVTLTDRHGRPLREILPPPMNRRQNRLLHEFSPHLIEAVIAAEDKRFRYHPGVDPLAALRALYQNLSQGKVVSGASTITMQLARLSQGLAPGPRTLGRKLRELYLALAIERHHPKDEILALYLNSAPVGGPNVGFGAGAMAWLGKSAARLSPAEAAFLAGLPARPGNPGPLAGPRSIARKDMILRRLAKAGRLSEDDLARALAEPLILSGARGSFLAPHFTNLVAKGLPAIPPRSVTTTLDLGLQAQIERLAAITVERYKGRGLRQVAVVVISLPEREILAYVGSADYFDPEEGQIDGVTTPRQPGSALKPFIYAHGLETGAISASSLIDDVPVDFVVRDGSYSPRNYSGASHGPVQARLALASSLNVPAINLTSHLGVDDVLAFLRKLGLSALSRDPGHYGLGLALGGGEVTLLELASAYATLADGGRQRPPAMTMGAPPAPGIKAMDPAVAFIVSDILADAPARATGFGQGGPLDAPYRVSAKTGTSKNFRDNWCLGYSDGFVVGVWAGNFQNRPMGNVSGITGAGHLWREVTDLMADMRPPAPELAMPPGVTPVAVCPVSGLLAGPDCPNVRMEYFLERALHGPRCVHGRMNLTGAGAKLAPGDVPVVGHKDRFGFIGPQHGETYAWDPGLPDRYQVLRATVQSTPDLDELVITHNGREIARRKVAGASRASVDVSLGRGRQLLEAAGLRDGRKVAADQAVFFVK
ncbi:MAG: penicillin-binding protein 1C [Deltaproteobacteria bacterium]|nr:penicillin-binding protein 1C [Deltaproteobacteria bacterium]